MNDIVLWYQTMKEASVDRATAGNTPRKRLQLFASLDAGQLA